MGQSLIAQYCSAIEQWAEVTRRDPFDVILYSMLHSGGVWHVRPEGAVEDPYAPEHRDKTVGEVEGRYTLDQLRTHLEYLSNEVHLMEDTLICGLVCCVENELTGLVVGYRPGLERIRQQAEEWEYLSKHLEEDSEVIQTMDGELKRQGFEGFGVENFSDMASFAWRMLGQRSDDEEAQRKSWLAAWKRVTAPVIECENLERWRTEYLERHARGHQHDQP
jgi:hypothetical protein